MFHTPGRRFSGALALALMPAAALALLAGGCSKTSPQPPPTTTTAPIAQTSSGEFDADDPCALLEPKEVEAVLGAPLATAPYRFTGGGPAAQGDTCVYETADFHRITLEVEFEGGAQYYGMTGFAGKLLGSHPDANVKKAFKLDNGTEIAGEWDEAHLMAMNCCNFVTMRGDQAIQIEFTSSDATLQQAAELVNAAYRRIGKPLKIDGAAAVDAAKAFAKSRPAKVEACTLLARAEVEAIIGKLAGNPTGQGDSCNYSVPDPRYPGSTRQYEVSIYWRGGYERFRSQPYIEGIGAAAILAQTPLAQQALKTQDEKPAEESGPWLHAGNEGNGFAAVKKDVLVQVNALGQTTPEMRKLAAAVMSRI